MAQIVLIQVVGLHCTEQASVAVDGQNFGRDTGYSGYGLRDLRN
jgi:hypothetical protein